MPDKTQNQNISGRSKEKNKKNKESKSAEAPIGTASAANQPEGGGQVEKPKGKGCLTCGIIAAVVIVLLIVGFVGLQILSFWFPPTFLFGFLSQFKGLKSITDNSGSSPKGTLQGKNLAGLVDPSKTVTKRISAKMGGQITVRTANGKYFTVNIGPGSLERDTDISLTPIEGSPIEGYPNLDDPGVVIGPPGTNLGNGSTVTVSEDPPAPEPGDPGADPGTNQDGGSTAPPGTSEDIPNFGDLSGLLGGNASMTVPSGSGNPSGQAGAANGNTGTNRNNRNTAGSSPSGADEESSQSPDTSVIILTGYGVRVGTVPTTHSDDDDSDTAPIDETGAASADDPDENESEDLADNEAAISGGTCSPEFLQVMAGAAQAGGAGSSAAQAALRDCFNVEWLNNLCVNDPVKLRRSYFEQRIALARLYDAQAASEIESLMNQCQAKYHFHGEGINPQSTGEVRISSSLDATVCGYIDDQWTGEEIYRLSAGADSFHEIKGTAEFNLPSGGGSFSGTARGENTMVIIGKGVAIPNFEAGFTGNFDGTKTIHNLYLVPAGVNASIVPIELQGKDCVPLAPLPH
jgi:hypothetical protein